jgi:chemotaxis protein MotB
MAKKKHEEEHENHERWLVSYADFITLLFAFFVVMYAVSRVDNHRLVQASNAIRWALHFEGTGGVGQLPLFEGPVSEGGCVANPGSGAQVTLQGKRVLESLRKRIESRLKPFLLQQKSASVVVNMENGTLTLRMAAAHFFDPSSAALRPEALPLIDAIGEEISDLGRPVRVEGHTDDSAVGGTRFRNNWDLSAARAVTVVSYLEQAHHISPDKLVAMGRASTKPLVPNDTPEHREMNRRVDISIELEPADSFNVAVR